MDVLDNCDRVYLSSQCGKIVKGAFDEGVLTILAMCHLTQTGDSDTLLLRKVEASTGDLSRMVLALKRYLEPKLKKVERIPVGSHTANRNLGILFSDTPRLAAAAPTGKRAALSIGSLLPAFRQKDIEKGRQECLPHLHTRILNGSTSLYAGVALIDWRIKQLNMTIACINQAYHLRKRADP